jgi:TRAP-type C4-dicarboxylate transport system permease small subunit
MYKKYFLIYAAILTLGCVFVGAKVLAQSDYGLSATARSAGIDTTVKDLPPLVGSIIGNLLSMIGVVFFVLMIYGGFLWMTARGNEDQTSKAFGTILAASIGILIVMGAYAITNFVFNSVTTAATTTTAPPAASP